MQIVTLRQQRQALLCASVLCIGEGRHKEVDVFVRKNVDIVDRIRAVRGSQKEEGIDE